MAAKVDKAKMPCNKPRRTPDHPTKSHIVKACEGGKEKIIRFGQQGKKVGELKIDTPIEVLFEGFDEEVYKKTDEMSDYIKNKFLNYPIPKAIVEEWEKVK